MLFFDTLADICSWQVCDVCGGAKFGDGLPAIRPLSKIFGVRNLPVIFQCCSTECRTTL